MVSNMTFGTSLTIFPDRMTTGIAKETAGSVKETIGVVAPLVDLELWPGVKLVAMRGDAYHRGLTKTDLAHVAA